MYWYRLELGTLDLSQADTMPALCQAAALVDTLLTASLTFYTATTFVYLFCRKPNPDVPSTSEMTLRVSHCTVEQRLY